MVLEIDNSYSTLRYKTLICRVSVGEEALKILEASRIMEEILAIQQQQAEADEIRKQKEDEEEEAPPNTSMLEMLFIVLHDYKPSYM
jgi:hypothetical protein